MRLIGCARESLGQLPGRILGKRLVHLGFAALAGGAAAVTAAAAVGAGGVGVLLLGAATLAYGTTIAPVGTVLFGRLSEVAGGSRATEAFGWMGAAMGVGGVLGDAGGGWLATRSPVVALAVAAGLALGTAALVRERRVVPA